MGSVRLLVTADAGRWRLAAQADQADPVRDLCDVLAAYLPRLAALLPEPDSPAGYADTGMTGALACSPVPGNAEAFFAATGIHGVARWWEAMLLYHKGASDIWNRRGGSDGNTLAALKHVVELAYGADDDTVGMLMRDLGRAEADAGAVPDIDEAQQWRHLRGRACPYCGRLATLKVLLDARDRPTGHVECFGGARANGERCLDRNGLRPAATIGTDERGVPELAWDDGRRELAPDLEG